MHYVYLVYGLAFFVLAAVVGVHPRRPGTFRFARALPLLVGFALVHGVHEWVELARLWEGDRPALRLLGAILGPVSFLMLLSCGVEASSSAGLSKRWLRGVAAVLVATWATIALVSGGEPRTVEATARYLLAFPGAVGFAYALIAERARMDSAAVGHRLTLATVGFVLYALVGGLIPAPASFPPASWLNSEVFFEITGVPVQVLRAAAALTIAAGVVRLLSIYDWAQTRDFAESEGRYRALVDAAPLGVGIGREGRLVAANPTLLRIMGASAPGEILGRKISSFIHPEDLPSFESVIGDLERGVLPGVREMRHRRLDGAEFIGEVSAAPLRLEGQPAIVAFVRDVTGRRAADEELRRHREELEALVQERTAELQAALAQVKTLGGLMPICAWCRRVRDDAGYWAQIEAWVESHSDATFTHGICPDCARKVTGREPPTD